MGMARNKKGYANAAQKYERMRTNARTRRGVMVMMIGLTDWRLRSRTNYDSPFQITETIRRGLPNLPAILRTSSLI